MRFADGRELALQFVFIEVDRPKRLVWQHTDHGKRKEGPPTTSGPEASACVEATDHEGRAVGVAAEQHTAVRHRRADADALHAHRGEEADAGLRVGD